MQPKETKEGSKSRYSWHGYSNSFGKKDRGGLDTAILTASTMSLTSRLNKKNYRYKAHKQTTTATKKKPGIQEEAVKPKWTLPFRNGEIDAAYEDVLQHITEPQPWKTLLQLISAHSDDMKLQDLVDWYDRAVESISVSAYRKDLLFHDICFEWIHLYKTKDLEDAKERLVWMEQGRIATHESRLYEERAQIEFEEGNVKKGNRILKEGIRKGASKNGSLERLLIQAGEDTDMSLLGDVTRRSMTLSEEDQKQTHTFAYSIEQPKQRSPLVDDFETPVSQDLKKLLENYDEEEEYHSPLEAFEDEQDFQKPEQKPTQPVQPVMQQRQPLSALKPTTVSSKHSVRVSDAFGIDKENIVQSTGKLGKVSIVRRQDGPQKPAKTEFTFDPKKRIEVNGKRYYKLDVVGKGGSGKVFRVVGEDSRIYALKRIKIKHQDERMIEAVRNEIDLLEKLRGKPHIITLFDTEENYARGIIYMLFEFGEIDLAKLLKRDQGSAMNVNQMRTIWQSMLEAVQTIHEERIVHGDLKPANFIFVSGELKLIDFGIAKTIQNDTTHIERNSQIGTVNYMSPEAIRSDMPSDESSQDTYKLKRSSDIWSLGCILYQMVYGKTPFHDIRRMVMKLIAISDEHYPIEYPMHSDPHVIDVLQRCLRRNPEERPPIPDLLSHSFLNPPQIQGDNVQRLLEKLQQAGLIDSRLDRKSLTEQLLQLGNSNSEIDIQKMLQ